jgi:hypothetical protein
MLLQTFVVPRQALSKHKDDLLDAAASLTNTSDSVTSFCEALQRKHLCVNDLEKRLELRAWIDALYFRLFGFELDEVGYVFDTFPIWKDKSAEIWGRFLEKERTIAIFSELEGEMAK